MIYQDSQAKYDTEYAPANRGGNPCINCGEDWGYHHGWGCDRGQRHAARLDFNQTTPQTRYLTQSMHDSIASVAPVNYAASVKVPRSAIYVDHVWNPNTGQFELRAQSPNKRDETHWRAWAHNTPGDCPCGIARAQCDYHR